MPKGPKGGKRPADVIGGAVGAMEIATGQRDEEPADAPTRCHKTGHDPGAIERRHPVAALSGFLRPCPHCRRPGPYRLRLWTWRRRARAFDTRSLICA